MDVSTVTEKSPFGKVKSVSTPEVFKTNKVKWHTPASANVGEDTLKVSGSLDNSGTLYALVDHGATKEEKKEEAAAEGEEAGAEGEEGEEGGEDEEFSEEEAVRFLQDDEDEFEDEYEEEYEDFEDEDDGEYEDDEGEEGDDDDEEGAGV